MEMEYPDMCESSVRCLRHQLSDKAMNIVATL